MMKKILLCTLGAFVLASCELISAPDRGQIGIPGETDDEQPTCTPPSDFSCLDAPGALAEPRCDGVTALVPGNSFSLSDGVPVWTIYLTGAASTANIWFSSTLIPESVVEIRQAYQTDETSLVTTPVGGPFITTRNGWTVGFVRVSGPEVSLPQISGAVSSDATPFVFNVTLTEDATGIVWGFRLTAERVGLGTVFTITDGKYYRADCPQETTTTGGSDDTTTTDTTTDTGTGTDTTTDTGTGTDTTTTTDTGTETTTDTGTDTSGTDTDTTTETTTDTGTGTDTTTDTTTDTGTGTDTTTDTTTDTGTGTDTGTDTGACPDEIIDCSPLTQNWPAASLRSTSFQVTTTGDVINFAFDELSCSVLEPLGKTTSAVVRFALSPMDQVTATAPDGFTFVSSSEGTNNSGLSITGLTLDGAPVVFELYRSADDLRVAFGASLQGQGVTILSITVTPATCGTDTAGTTDTGTDTGTTDTGTTGTDTAGTSTDTGTDTSGTGTDTGTDTGTTDTGGTGTTGTDTGTDTTTDTGTDTGPAPFCGDLICNGSETSLSCPGDCGPPPPVCGDGTCNGSETKVSCPADCGPAVCEKEVFCVPANGMWPAPDFDLYTRLALQFDEAVCEVLSVSETPSRSQMLFTYDTLNGKLRIVVPANFKITSHDVGDLTGDRTLDQIPVEGEATLTVTRDDAVKITFTATATFEKLTISIIDYDFGCTTGPTCGDTICDAGENSSTCPGDCGPPPPVCGDAICEPGENLSCPSDCGPPPPVCGDATCDPGENLSCPGDCGPPPPVCGNFVCEAGELGICPLDCPLPGICGDGTCDPGEQLSCEQDCLN
jgi:hypothetical protein